VPELRIATGGAKDDLWISNTPLGASNRAIGATLWGIGETLTRVSATGNLIPWLAESVRNIDPLTWHVGLRPAARFWDNTPVTAEEVTASIAETRTAQRDPDLLLGSDTRVRALDGTTVEFRTTEPVGHLPNALAHPQLTIHKRSGSLMTGPYRAVEFEDDRQLTLEPFVDHWAGRPPLDRISVSVQPDLEARMHMLQSGQVDAIYGFPPESVDQLSRFGANFEVTSVPTVRLVFIQLNCARPPFDDRDLREATALAIDRGALVRDVLGDHGAVATSFVPTYMSPDEQPIQCSDPRRAEQQLDAIGWLRGPAGVRVKNGTRLAFNLLTPTGPVLAVTPLARGVARQLSRLGYDVTVQAEELPEFHRQIHAGGFSASMAASIALLTGDPWFLMRVRMASDGRANPGSYANPEFDRELENMRHTIDAAARQASWRRLQAILKVDAPRVLLVFLPNIVVASAGRLQGLTRDPNNEYFIDGRMTTTMNVRTL
jgi:peptide/nickel transport system substrate-binding protein